MIRQWHIRLDQHGRLLDFDSDAEKAYAKFRLELEDMAAAGAWTAYHDKLFGSIGQATIEYEE